MTQVDLARVSGLHPSQISRLLNGREDANREKLDSLLLAFPDRAHRFDLVRAYLLDSISESARGEIRFEARSELPQTGLNTELLSPDGEAALRYLLGLDKHIEDVEAIIRDLASALGWTRSEPERVRRAKRNKAAA
jgi:transcriptional regulator with XRE-family HTH domain